MKEFILGLVIGLICMGILMGIMAVDYIRQFRELEHEAYQSCQDARDRAFSFGKERVSLYREIDRLKRLNK